jgi:hypothetical protein
MFLGFSKRKTILSPGEIVDITIQIVGLVEGLSCGTLLITVDQNPSTKRTFLIPLRVFVTSHSADDLWGAFCRSVNPGAFFLTAGFRNRVGSPCL